MTKEQEKISIKNKRKAWNYFVSIGEIPADAKPHEYALHHKDITLRQNDIERYILWLPDDLVVMTKSEHMKLHWQIAREDGEMYESWCRKRSETLKGRHLSEEHKKHLSESMKGKNIGNQNAKKKAVLGVV